MRYRGLPLTPPRQRLTRVQLMETISATDARSGFERLLDAARRGPVTIERDGRPVAVMLSVEEYERLEALKDAIWAVRAAAAEDAGDWLGGEDSEKLLSAMLVAEG